jgi:hydroxypyruvate isomerase
MKVTRKQALKTLAAGAITTISMPSFSKSLEKTERPELKGLINHSVCQWCYGSIPVEDLVKAAKSFGINSVELLGADQWPIVLKHGLTCAMGYATSIGLNRGFNDPTLHEQLLKDYTVAIPKAADAGLKISSVSRATETVLLTSRVLKTVRAAWNLSQSLPQNIILTL